MTKNNPESEAKRCTERVGRKYCEEFGHELPVPCGNLLPCKDHPQQETACQFIYNGHTGPNGRVCGRPEREHCPDKAGEHHCPSHPVRKVHHVFTRTFKCPTCGSTNAPRAQKEKA